MNVSPRLTGKAGSRTSNRGSASQWVAECRPPHKHAPGAPGARLRLSASSICLSCSLRRFCLGDYARGFPRCRGGAVESACGPGFCPPGQVRGPKRVGARSCGPIPGTVADAWRFFRKVGPTISALLYQREWRSRKLSTPCCPGTRRGRRRRLSSRRFDPLGSLWMMPSSRWIGCSLGLRARGPRAP